MPEKPNQGIDIFEKQFMNVLMRKTSETNNKHTLSMQPFIDLYGLNKVKSDYAEIADKILTFNKTEMTPEQKMGHIFEAAFLDLGSSHNWFGGNSEITRASRYDDIKFGVDMVGTVVNPENTAQHFEIASDLTFSYNKAGEKFMRIRNDLHRGKMAQMNYYHSDLMGYTGQLRNIPRTVIALDTNNLQKFLVNWVREPELEQLQFGAVMMRQIKEQSETFSYVCSKKHGKNHATTRNYQRTEEISNRLLDTVYSGLEIPDDRISELLGKHCKTLRDNPDF